LLKHFPKSHCLASLFVFCAVTAGAAAECEARDFLDMPLNPTSENLQLSAVLKAYPQIVYDAASNELVSPAEDRRMLLTEPTDLPPEDMLTSASFADQFLYVYPLNYDQLSRVEPWFDPGRLRNAAFMEFLYFSDEPSARASLQDVTHDSSGVRFRVTNRQGVSCQLAAVFESIGDQYPDVFESVGGSFNWRTISGTSRLSVHSYGAAVDLNTELGGYWIWSGAKAGSVGDYQSGIPREVVAEFERYGFIWGGKWHHFDGMHFEFRPELILYSRLVNTSG
jgi:hypothetical protein